MREVLISVGGTLEELNFGENSMHDYSVIDYLGEAIGAHMPNLRKLDLVRNPLTGQGVTSLLNTMISSGQNLKLQSLAFTGAPLGDEGLALLLPLITSHFPSLTHLNLTACRISVLSLPEVVKWIEKPEMLWPRKLLQVELQY